MPVDTAMAIIPPADDPMMLVIGTCFFCFFISFTFSWRALYAPT